MEKNKNLQEIKSPTFGDSLMDELNIQRLNYPRVSDIIGKQTEREMRSIPLDVLANAALRGTKIHSYCTALIKDLWVPEIESEYQPYVDAFSEWANKNIFQVYFTNTRLYDDQLKFSGEFDMIVKLKNDDRFALLDLKTSSAPSKSWPLQMAAYKHLCELNGYEVELAYNIHLKKTVPAKYEESPASGKIMVSPPKVKTVIIPRNDINESWKIFTSSLDCYNYFEKKEKEQ